MNETPTETEAADDPGVAILAEYTHSPAELLARLDHARATTQQSGGSLVLADREAELLELKGPCSDVECRLHYAHRGPHDIVKAQR